MSFFYRSNFNEICLTLKSNEELGILDTGYIEDYFGNSNQVNIENLDNNQVFAINVFPVPAETPLIDNDAFRGCFLLASVPDGSYRLLARVRDVLGNYSIIGAVEDPIGNENTYNINFVIREGTGLRITYGPLLVEAANHVDIEPAPEREITVVPTNSIDVIDIRPINYNNIVVNLDSDLILQ